MTTVRTDGSGADDQEAVPTAPRRRGTLKDVAAAAGVHPSTASRSLDPTQASLVSAATRERVLAAARKLNYRPDRIASAFRRQKTFTIGTRKSKLALLQTDLVLAALKNAFPQYEYKIFSKETAGDLNTTIALREFTTKNLWTEELEELMIGGQVDLIVHSLKRSLIASISNKLVVFGPV